MAGQLKLVGMPPSPPRPPKKLAPEWQLFEEFQTSRRAKLVDDLGIEFVPDNTAPALVVLGVRRMLSACSGPEELLRVFDLWLGDEWAASLTDLKSGAPMPFTFQVLARPKVFRNFLERARGIR